MSRQEIDEYFAGVGEWMKTDIKREIQLALASRSPEGGAALSKLDVPPGGGNLLAALGLVSYTEALGRLRVWNRTGRYGSSEECFNAFFDHMASGRYKTWWAGWPGSGGKPVYDVLRNGLVHEYRPKVDSAFHIGPGYELGLGERDGRLIFGVATYYEHFCDEMEALHAELVALGESAEIPPPKGTPRSGGGPPGFGSAGGGSAGAGPSSRGPVVSPTSTPGS